MRRRRINHDKPRQKRTLIPSFDPEDLAKAIEQQLSRATTAPPFDPSAYARIVERHMLSGGEARSLPTVAAGHAEPASASAATVPAPSAHVSSPDLAAGDSDGRALTASSVLRLRRVELDKKAAQLDPTSSFVLGHVDGVSDAGTIAQLTGLPPPEAIDRLHALLDLGVLELVSA